MKSLGNVPKVRQLHPKVVTPGSQPAATVTPGPGPWNIRASHSIMPVSPVPLAKWGETPALSRPVSPSGDSGAPCGLCRAWPYAVHCQLGKWSSEEQEVWEPMGTVPPRTRTGPSCAPGLTIAPVSPTPNHDMRTVKWD